MGPGDAVDQAFALILADDRRKLDQEAEAAAKRLWRSVFQDTAAEDLKAAVLSWLKEHRRGRPNVGEVEELLKRRRHPPTVEEKRKAEYEVRKRDELAWAVTILENQTNWVGDYRHTREYAELCLKAHGFTSWQDAKVYLEPGWGPPMTKEAYL